MIPSKHLRNLLLRRLFHVPKLSITTPTESSHESIEKFEIHCKTVKQLEALGGILAEKAKVGDVYLLTGSVGAGKTCLARGFIRKMTGSKHLAVTSPTFLLDNTYEVKDKEHMYERCIRMIHFFYALNCLLAEFTTWTCIDCGKTPIIPSLASPIYSARVEP